MADESKTTHTITEMVNWLERQFQLSDEGVGPNRKGAHDGRISIAEIEQDYQRRRIPDDNALKLQMTSLVKQYPGHECAIRDLSKDIKAAFEQVDQNHDGYLTPTELRAAPKGPVILRPAGAASDPSPSR